jgi:hypothetical protein
MKSLTLLAVAATLAGGLVTASVVPVNAGISIGIGIPGGYYGGHPGRWCYNHPGACGGYAGPYAEGGYWAGHGYWHGGRWWNGRDRWRGGWRYR